MTRASGLLKAVRRFAGGGGLPAFLLWLLLFYELLLAGVLLVPPGPSALEAFAEEFRVWCFGYDPATGRTEWAYVMAMTLPQAMLGSVLLLVWWEPLRELLARPRALARYAAAAAGVVGLAAAGLALLGSAPDAGALPFPAEALRTAYRAPEFRLTNQAAEPVDLSELRGNVVLLTATYASCPHTCPLLLAQSKNAIAELTPEEREDLRVIAVTLDPERDSVDILAELARLQEMPAPLFNLVTGEPAQVERVLDEMGVARKRDPETGIIDHASRAGKVAYRFGLGERQQEWLVSALRILLREQPEAG
jgi:cytochrome oxidase Cu insertion factor (SCO1/SenC/PrrC family)